MNPKNALLRYLTYGHTDRKTRLLSFLSPFKVAEELYSKTDFNSFSCEVAGDGTQARVRLETADKGAPVSHPVFRYLQANPHPALLAASLFGSLADGTSCAYSDFDGVLVVDCSRISSAVSLFRLRTIIARSEELMLETDPLQHHGWHFSLTDSRQRVIGLDLPVSVLSDCKIVIPSHAIELELCNSILEDNPIDSYFHTSDSIRRKLSDNRSIECIYTFKSLCSEFMLLPALFVQAKGQPVSKKDSFKVIEKNFNPERLSAIRTVSEWRRIWEKPELSNQIRLFHAGRKTGMRLSFLLPGVPARIKNAYPEWKKRAESFLLECDNALKHHRHQS